MEQTKKQIIVNVAIVVIWQICSCLTEYMYVWLIIYYCSVTGGVKKICEEHKECK